MKATLIALIFVVSVMLMTWRIFAVRVERFWSRRRRINTGRVYNATCVGTRCECPDEHTIIQYTDLMDRNVLTKTKCWTKGNYRDTYSYFPNIGSMRILPSMNNVKLYGSRNFTGDITTFQANTNPDGFYHNPGSIQII